MIRRGILYEMGIPASEDNAKELEEKISDIVGLKGEDCSKVWSRVNEWLEDPKMKETLREKLAQ